MRAPRCLKKWSISHRLLLARARSRHALVLSFDDGPGVNLTPLVAAALARGHAKATFFLLGKRAQAQPEIVSQLAEAGHELACHTHDHLNAWRVPPHRAAADISRGYQTLAPWVPAKGHFRPPYGKLTPLSALQIRRRGARIVLWTHDSGDTADGELPRAEQVVEAVVRDGGGVVLMHDFDREGIAAGQRADYVIEVTEGLLAAARQSGLRVMTVGELFREETQ